MVDNPVRIVITGEVPHCNESERLTALLETGWTFVHLRYPGLSLREVRGIIEGIPQKFHRRLKLHGHFELINEFNLGGLHLNRRCPAPPKLYSGELSRSCHTVKDIAEAARTGVYSYVTLSPIFSSISKQGYEPALSRKEIREATELMPVIALGGITPDSLTCLKNDRFAGYAVLGALVNIEDCAALKNITMSFLTSE